MTRRNILREITVFLGFSLDSLYDNLRLCYAELEQQEDLRDPWEPNSKAQENSYDAE
jgi:hypothetical protein